MNSARSNPSEQKVSLLALIFFLMGALPLYSYFQGAGQRNGEGIASLNSHPLVRMAIFGLALAGAFELVSSIAG